MNKAELISALAERLDGDRKAATAAVDGLLDVIVKAVQSGDSVSLTGFGVFERRERAARSGRNPRTGQVIQVAATSVPAFRPGATFRNTVSGVTTGTAPVRATRARAVPVPASAAAPEPSPAVVVVADEPAAANGKPAKAKAAKTADKAAKSEKTAKSDKAAKTVKDAKDGKPAKKKAKK